MSNDQIGFDFPESSTEAMRAKSYLSTDDNKQKKSDALANMCDALVNMNFISAIDKYLVMTLAEKDDQPHVVIAVLLLNQAVRQGHVCINMQYLATLPDNIHPQIVEVLKGFLNTRIWSSADEWYEALKRSSLTNEGGNQASDAYVLKLEAERLYFMRYWQDETLIFDKLIALSKGMNKVDESTITEIFQLLYPHIDETNLWQAVAVLTALQSQLLILTGGPGTGKTTTVLNILSMLLHQADIAQHKLVVKLVAPTGKAAARMHESIINGLARLPDQLQLLFKGYTTEAYTIHRLLGYFPGTDTFKYDAHTPFDADVLVIDEASMIDQYLMARLLSALPAHCKVIMLGDKDQLASVEAGAVLGELCARPMNDFSPQHLNYLSQWLPSLASSIQANDQKTTHTLADVMVHLSYSHRFKGEIKTLASAINEQNIEALTACLASPLVSIDFVYLADLQYEQFKQQIYVLYADYLATVRQSNTFSHALFEAFNAVQVLCPVKDGRFGAVAINTFLTEMAMTQPHESHARFSQSRHFHGQPVMVTQNDYTNALFNGDVGIILNINNEWKVGFVHETGIRVLNLNRLQAYETVFAMTIHKSQGSEFQHTIIVLPEMQSHVLTKELLYTGVTRAKQQLTLYSSLVAMQTTAQKRTQRYAGLAAKL